MRIVPYILLGYVAVGLQVGLSGYVHLGGAAPNLVLIVAAFVALFANRDAALLACFALGLMQDLLTQQTLGLYAFSYGCMALAIVATAASIYREHPITHAAVALLASMWTWLLLILHGWIFSPSGSPATAPGFATAFYGTLLTTLAAPVLIRVLLKLRPMLGLRVPRRW